MAGPDQVGNANDEGRLAALGAEEERRSEAVMYPGSAPGAEETLAGGRARVGQESRRLPSSEEPPPRPSTRFLTSLRGPTSPDSLCHAPAGWEGSRSPLPTFSRREFGRSRGSRSCLPGAGAQVAPHTPARIGDQE